MFQLIVGRVHPSFSRQLEWDLWNFCRFDFFREVIAEGKQLEYIDEYVGPFLLEWLPGLLASPQAADALNLIIVLVKFNSAYLDEPVVTGYVK